MKNRNGRVRLTERLVEAASKSGRKFFDVRFSIWGQKRCMRIGEWPVVSLKEARAAAIEIRADVARGSDPSEAKRTTKAIPTLRR